MYRAKIEGVSGSKVYADGKWLFSIGNKNFRTGDFVWTDGRCAYGHFQEAQQPQVIIAPDDEGIPIYASHYREHNLYTFQKTKLKQVDKIERPKFLPSSDWIYYSLINDKRRVFKHKYLASNIDSKGNIFVMAEFYKIDDDGYYTEYKVAIFKNDKTSRDLKFNKVKEIDLLEFLDDKFAQNCPEINCAAIDVPLSGDVDEKTGHHYTPREIGVFGSSYDITIRHAFIDDDNNFELIVYGGYGVFFSLPNNDILASTGYEAFYQIKNDETNLIRAVTSIGEVEWSIGSAGFLRWKSGTEYFHTTETETNNAVKCSVGDGFYCIMQWQRYPPFVEYGIKAAGGEFRYHFFSQDNNLIADVHANSRLKMLFCKVKGGFLISISNYNNDDEGILKFYDIFGQSTIFESSGEEIENEYVSGIFFYSKAKEKIIRLNQSGNRSNDRLRPMKKIKGWHKRIKEIVLDFDNEKDT